MLVLSGLQCNPINPTKRIMEPHVLFESGKGSMRNMEQKGRHAQLLNVAFARSIKHRRKILLQHGFGSLNTGQVETIHTGERGGGGGNGRFRITDGQKKLLIKC